MDVSHRALIQKLQRRKLRRTVRGSICGVCNRYLHGGGHTDVEKGSVDSLDGNQLLLRRHLLRSKRSYGNLAMALLVLTALRKAAIGCFNGCDAEYWFPVVLLVVTRVAKPSGCESPPRPGVAQVDEVPLGDLRVGMLVQYIANVDETLDSGDIYVID